MHALQQQQQQKITLEGDIKIAERERDKILSDLDRLQQTKIQEFERSANEIKQAKKRVSDLNELVAAKREEYTKLCDQNEKLQKEMHEYNLSEMQKVEHVRDEIVKQADETLQHAQSKQDQAEALEAEIADCLSSIEETDDAIAIEKDQLATKERDLIQLQKDTEKSVTAMKLAIAELEKKRDDLTTDVKDAEILKASLDKGIEKAIEFMKQTKREADSILAEAKRLKVISEKERESNEKNRIQLANDRRKLADDIETNKRAYREIVQRRGNAING